MFWSLLSLLNLILNSQVISASSNVSCLPFYSWTSNSQMKSPCDVASSLLAVCNNGNFPIDALPQSSHYVGPSIQNANPCQCNTVTYSLISACGACQGRTYLSWSVWSANCGMVYIDSYPEPIPSNVSVPGWAYLDVKAHDNFDQTNARQNANLMESSAIPTPTATVVAKAPHVMSTTTQQVPASLSPSSSSAASPTDAVLVGCGVVGGLFGLLLLFGLLYWYFNRRKRIARHGSSSLLQTHSNSVN